MEPAFGNDKMKPVLRLIRTCRKRRAVISYIDAFLEPFYIRFGNRLFRLHQILLLNMLRWRYQIMEKRSVIRKEQQSLGIFVKTSHR